jgi:hypothetical protein
MGNILYYVALILVIMWLVGFIGFGSAVGSYIHILIVLAVIALLIRVIKG